MHTVIDIIDLERGKAEAQRDPYRAVQLARHNRDRGGDLLRSHPYVSFRTLVNLLCTNGTNKGSMRSDRISPAHGNFHIALD